DGQLVENGAGPRLPKLLQHGVVNVYSADFDRRLRSGVNRVHEIDDVTVDLAARGDSRREPGVPMVEVLEPIAVVLPPGEIEGVARAKFEKRSNPTFRKGEIARDSHLRNVLIGPPLGGGCRRCRRSARADQGLVPDPGGQEVRVTRYEAPIDPPRREIFDNPCLRLGIPQTLREGNVDVRPEPFAERESRRRIDNGGDRREIRDPFSL